MNYNLSSIYKWWTCIITLSKFVYWFCTRQPFTWWNILINQLCHHFFLIWCLDISKKFNAVNLLMSIWSPVIWITCVFCIVSSVLLLNCWTYWIILKWFIIWSDNYCFCMNMFVACLREFRWKKLIDLINSLILKKSIPIIPYNIIRHG